MSTQTDDNADLVKESLLYKEFLAEREEILRHKWIESERPDTTLALKKPYWIGLLNTAPPGAPSVSVLTSLRITSS